MEYQIINNKQSPNNNEIINLIENTQNKSSKFKTRNWLK